MNKVQDLFRLNGRVALVTGGAGLLGSEFCYTLASAGASVIIADQDIHTAEIVAKALIADGYPALAIKTDVTSPSSVQAMVNAAIEKFHRLDILVNSAALDPKFDPQHINSSATAANIDQVKSGRRPFEQRTIAFEDFPLESWKQAIEVNLTGAFLCCQAAARQFLQIGGGVIINLSSIYGLAGPDQRMYHRPGYTAQYKPVYYSVTKSGILGLTRYLATYYAGKNIRVNALSPGGVYNGHDETFVQAYAARTVLGRMANKDEMNGALLFLASDASSYMTGSNLVVDGGWTAW